ncbi:hypothetical protein Y032_0023g756 [Ancylostoma ceylanicum]|uniref:Uncharacterized protein n=1 Tax=Ancylostoma ceylanicum TaxID=53326 RepID=A0A016UWP8_9BILA|nr:hypothetical protein Y032_0023g756 [Ancylostoma ceylanicum]
MHTRILLSVSNVDLPKIFPLHQQRVDHPDPTNETGSIMSLSNDSMYEEDIPADEFEAKLSGIDHRLESDSQGEQDSNTNASSFHECISNGILDMKAASHLLLTQKQLRTYSSSVYQEFIHSDTAFRIDSFCFDGLDGHRGINLELRLIANQIQGDIICSKVGKFTRMLEICNNNEQHKKKLHISLQNTTKSWGMNGPEPFAKVSLNEIAMDYHSRPNDNVFQLFTSFYRFLLQKITHPAYRIQEYAIRRNGRGGRDGTLKNLPRNIERMLLDFLEDLIGYGTKEAQRGQLCRERLAYRADMFRSLQAALRDIRSYSYDHVERKFVPNDRKAKRAHPERLVTEENDEE